MHNVSLHRFTVAVAIFTLLLVVAGGLATSNDAGLSVPDWPLSYGKLMPKMEGGIFFEHGHRVITGMILWIVVRVLLRHAEHAALRQSALVLLTIAMSQPMAVMVGFTVAHVAMGALTMAASVVLAVEIFRHVRRPEVEMAHGGVTVAS